MNLQWFPISQRIKSHTCGPRQPHPHHSHPSPQTPESSLLSVPGANQLCAVLVGCAPFNSLSTALIPLPKLTERVRGRGRVLIQSGSKSHPALHFCAVPTTCAEGCRIPSHHCPTFSSPMQPRKLESRNRNPRIQPLFCSPTTFTPNFTGFPDY